LDAIYTETGRKVGQMILVEVGVHTNLPRARYTIQDDVPVLQARGRAGASPIRLMSLAPELIACSRGGCVGTTGSSGV